MKIKPTFTVHFVKAIFLNQCRVAIIMVSLFWHILDTETHNGIIGIIVIGAVISRSSMFEKYIMGK